VFLRDLGRFDDVTPAMALENTLFLAVNPDRLDEEQIHIMQYTPRFDSLNNSTQNIFTPFVST
jgi:hypothetical protein